MDISLYYQEQGKGEPLILLHGTDSERRESGHKRNQTEDSDPDACDSGDERYD